MVDRSPLPSFLTRPLGRPRLELAILVAIACGACGLAGAYPRFEDANVYRLVMAVAAAAGGASVVLGALGAGTRARAFGRAMGLAAVLGVASTVVPAAILASNLAGNQVFFMVVIFGPLFGGPTGLLYGLPLAILAAVVFPHARSTTHDARDRLTRAASLWSMVIALVPLLTSLYDLDLLIRHAGPSAPMATYASLVVAPFIFAVGCLRAMKAHLRLVARRKWLAKVRACAEPAFRVRVEPEGEVLEWFPPANEEASPYREQERVWTPVVSLDR